MKSRWCICLLPFLRNKYKPFVFHDSLIVQETGSSISLNDYSCIRVNVNKKKSQIHETAKGFVAEEDLFRVRTRFFSLYQTSITCLQEEHLEQDADHESLNNFHHIQQTSKVTFSRGVLLTNLLHIILEMKSFW